MLDVILRHLRFGVRHLQLLPVGDRRLREDTHRCGEAPVLVVRSRQVVVELRLLCRTDARPRDGIAVPPGDEEAFVSALSRIIRDRSLRQELGERGLEFVEVNYSKERLFEDIKGLYGELMNDGRVADRELRVADFRANSHSKFP